MHASERSEEILTASEAAGLEPPILTATELGFLDLPRSREPDESFDVVVKSGERDRDAFQRVRNTLCGVFLKLIWRERAGYARRPGRFDKNGHLDRSRIWGADSYHG